MALMQPGGGTAPFHQIPQTMVPLAGQPQTMLPPHMLAGPQTGFGPASFNPMQSLFKTMFGGTGLPGQTGLGGTGDWMQRLMGIFGSQGGPSGSPFGMFGSMFGPHSGSGGFGQGADYGGFGSSMRQ